MALWLEYNSILYSKVPSAALVTVQELQEHNMRDQFLMKLRPEYEPIRRQLMARSPIPTLTECFREIMREEQTMFTRSSIEEAAPGIDSMALMTRGNFRVGKEVQCYSCQEYGHIAKECKKKVCNYCKKGGHIISECRRRPQNRRNTMQALAVPNQQNTTTVAAPTAIQSSSNSSSTVTPEAIQQMIQAALSAMGLSGNNSQKWYIDSGASNHMCGQSHSFQSITPYTGTDKISTADGTNLSIAGIGDVSLKDNTLSEVMFVPKLASNLISVGQLVENNCHVHFTPHGCVVQDQETGKIVGKAHKSGRLFCVKGEQNLSDSVGSVLSASLKEDPWILWHRKLGHLNSNSLSVMFDKGLLSNKKISPSVCVTCLLGKSKILPFPVSNNKTKRPFELVHSDVWGPSPILSSSGFKYFVLFIDDFTKFTWVYLMRNKSDVLQIFKYYVGMI